MQGRIGQQKELPEERNKTRREEPKGNWVGGGGTAPKCYHDCVKKKKKLGRNPYAVLTVAREKRRRRKTKGRPTKGT